MEKRKINREATEELITKFEDISDKTELPYVLDVVYTNAALEFTVDATKMPIQIDYISDEAVIDGMEAAKELSILDKTILNAFNPELNLSEG